MDIKEWITIISVIALIIGWFTNSWLNRKNEIAKERLKYRMDTLKSIIIVLSELDECIKFKKGVISPSLNRLMYDTIQKFYIYGKEDEIILCERFAKAADDKNNIEFEISLNELAELVKKRIRKELNLRILQTKSPYC